MDRPALEKAVTEAYVKEFGEAAFSLEASFKSLGFTSLQTVRLLFILEEALDHDLADANLHECQNLSEVIERLDKL